MVRDSRDAFAIWITGLPASGKSTLARALETALAERRIDVAVLESDELRKILTPEPRYDEEERDRFYRQLLFLGELLVQHGVPVIFDATANRRAWREAARRALPRFLEVFVDTALETCVSRDPKGIYRQALSGAARTVPGIQSSYEAPEHPDLVIGGTESPEAAARRVLDAMSASGFIRLRAPRDDSRAPSSA